MWALCTRAYVGRLPSLPPRVNELLSLEEAAELQAAAKARHFALQRLRALVVEARRGLCTAEVREMLARGASCERALQEANSTASRRAA